jgi:hypothetical protein
MTSQASSGPAPPRSEVLLAWTSQYEGRNFTMDNRKPLRISGP